MTEPSVTIQKHLTQKKNFLSLPLLNNIRQKIEDVIMNVFNQNIEVAGPITRIKQETEDTKDYLRCALYSSVKSEPPPLEIGKYESSEC